MFEAMTYEFILNRALKNAQKNNPNIDIREGSILYNAIAPMALELAICYVSMDNILNESYADTATRENLIKRAKERGLSPKTATNAIRQGEFNNNIEIPINSRFSLNVLNYRVIKKIEPGIYQLQCETPGEIGNVESGKLIPIDYVEGLKDAQLTSVIIPGQDDEDTEIFRQRYFNSLNSKAFGGNITDYKEKTKSINGVGGVKVHRAWRGGGTVKLVIINSEFDVPTDFLINEIQNQIDPKEHQGDGQGLAPIGHTVTVAPVGIENINIKTNITFKDGWDWENSQTYLNECIENYLQTLSQNWERTDNLIVRISQIESHLLTVESVLDIKDTLINDVAENYTLQSDNIPKLGGIISA